MKKVILTLIIGLLISLNVKAIVDEKRTGEWKEVYDGSSTVQYQECVYHWFWSECVVGDTKSL